MSKMESLFAHSQSIPAIPAVVHELIATFDQQDVDIDTLAKKISHDQALTAKVLRLANTPAYGGSRKVASIGDAVMVLGFNTVRTLVLSCGLVSAFRPPEGFDIKHFWHECFRTAETCKWLARACRQDGEIAFTCGLIHDVGSMIMHVAMPEQAVSIDKAVALGGSRASLESALLGYNYADVGAELAQRWKFPDVIVQGIQHQEDPLAASKFSTLAGLIYLSQRIMQGIDVGMNAEQMAELLPRDVLEALKLNPDVVLSRFDELKAVGDAIDSFLG